MTFNIGQRCPAGDAANDSVTAAPATQILTGSRLLASDANRVAFKSPNIKHSNDLLSLIERTVVECVERFFLVASLGNFRQLKRNAVAPRKMVVRTVLSIGKEIVWLTG